MDKVSKVFLMIFVTTMVMQDKVRLNLLVWVMTLSYGFYGVKGGIFVVTTGGAHMVLGPSGSFFKTHGEVGMVMAMALPFMRYMQLNFRNPELFPREIHSRIPEKWYGLIHMGFTAAMFLTGAAILGTHSRGAMLAGGMTAAFLLWKSRNKFGMTVAILIAVPALLSLMPEKWFNRMETIETPEQDASSRGRINAWWMAYNLANDRFLGGGFNHWTWREFAQYAPHPEDVHDAHSIYFEVLGEHGWIGLAIFLTLALVTWHSASRVARKAKRHPSTMWLKDLVTMSQVSIAAYATSGAFIGQAYFDAIYVNVAIIVLSKVVLAKELARIEQAEHESTVNDRQRAVSRSQLAYGGQGPPGRGPGG
jgi:probable O-glycosylation ligase (exosortase A-associated)